MLIFTVQEAVYCHTIGRSRSAGQSTDLVLLAVPEAVSCLKQVRSRSAGPSHLSNTPRCSRRSLMPYESEEHHFCEALQLKINVLAGCYLTRAKTAPAMAVQTVIFNLFHPFSAYLSLFKPNLAYLNLLKHIPAYFSLF